MSKLISHGKQKVHLRSEYLISSSANNNFVAINRDVNLASLVSTTFQNEVFFIPAY